MGKGFKWWGKALSAKSATYVARFVKVATCCLLFKLTNIYLSMILLTEQLQMPNALD